MGMENKCHVLVIMKFQLTAIHHFFQLDVCGII